MEERRKGQKEMARCRTWGKMAPKKRKRIWGHLSNLHVFGAIFSPMSGRGQFSISFFGFRPVFHSMPGHLTCKQSLAYKNSKLVSLAIIAFFACHSSKKSSLLGHLRTPHRFKIPQRSPKGPPNEDPPQAASGWVFAVFLPFTT